MSAVASQRSPFTLRAALRRQVVLICALAALGLCLIAGAVWGIPTMGGLLAGLLLGLAITRAVASADAVGALAVRRKRIDVPLLLIMALGLAVLAASPNL